MIEKPFYVIDTQHAYGYLEGLSSELDPSREGGALYVTIEPMIHSHIQYLLGEPAASIRQNLIPYLGEEAGTYHGDNVHDILLSQVSPIYDRHSHARFRVYHYLDYDYVIEIIHPNHQSIVEELGVDPDELAARAP